MVVFRNCLTVELFLWNFFTKIVLIQIISKYFSNNFTANCLPERIKMLGLRTRPLQKSELKANGIFLMSKILLIIVRFYQLVLSPMKPPTCRFTPTCSQYMLEAVKKYGAWKGLHMGLRRMSRCHPWGDSGYDPVE